MVYFRHLAHFGHANIIRYCNRPFLYTGDLDSNGDWVSKSIARKRAIEMDNKLVNNWNAKIATTDRVFHLGDFCMGDTRQAMVYLRRLNYGQLYFIFGNHDKAMKELSKSNEVLRLFPNLYFLGDMFETKVENQIITLNHYAMRVWGKSHHGAWQLYGHSHGTLPDDPHSLSIDVGVDCHDYSPISFEEVKKKMAKKLWRPIDHHGERVEGGGAGLSREAYVKAERQRLYKQLKAEFEPL